MQCTPAYEYLKYIYKIEQAARSHLEFVGKCLKMLVFFALASVGDFRRVFGIIRFYSRVCAPED